MTTQIALVLAILVVSLVLFVTEKLRMDVVALLVLGVIAMTGLVSPAEALSGFSNPAVITVWAMFILSAGLTATGVANVIGRHVLRLAGRGEVRMVLVIMLTAGGLSAFMNNIGVAALMLPVVMDIARRTGRPPSRLLMPLAYGTLLGGLTTLIGTPPNLLVSDALRDRGLRSFQLFDFMPVGGLAALAGVLFVGLVGRKFLPARDISRESQASSGPDLKERYDLENRTALARLRGDSPLSGMTLLHSRLGFATGLNVVAVQRAGRTIPAPEPEFVLHGGDHLVVEGRFDRFNELQGWREMVLEDEDLTLDRLVSDDVGLADLTLNPDSILHGKTLGQVHFRTRFGVNVLALRRGDAVIQDGLADTSLEAGDRLLVQGEREQLADLTRSSDFTASGETDRGRLLLQYGLNEHIFMIHIPRGSILKGKTLARSRLGDALRLGVMGIVREGVTRLMPMYDELLQDDDRLIVRGDPRDLEVFRGLQQLEIEEGTPPDLRMLESDEAGLLEVMLAPRTTLAGKTLQEIDFREKYGLRVLSIMRKGEVHPSGLGGMPLRFGDALLVYGRREKHDLLARDSDFLVLTRDPRRVPRREKGPLAAVIMAGILMPVLFGWWPISIASVVGATLMVATGCLSMDEGYRAIDWKSIFLIAGMLPLGTAMQQTGAASFLAEQVLAVTRVMGPWGVIVGLYLVTAVATTIVPTAALVVLMAPIALKASADLGISPQATMMAVGIAASASFTSPISHPANVLVMGPGGYRFSDYVKVGIPLALVVMVVAMLLLPVFWPL